LITVKQLSVFLLNSAEACTRFIKDNNEYDVNCSAGHCSFIILVPALFVKNKKPILDIEKILTYHLLVLLVQIAEKYDQIGP
jgi:hypothetical protein